MHAERHFFLHKWKIELFSNYPPFLKNIEYYLGHYFESPKRRPPAGLIPVKIELNVQSGELPLIASPYNLRHLGILRLIDFDRNEIKIIAQRKGKMPQKWLYHYCFLRPLFYLLRKYHFIFVHASLLAKNKSGVLIMGPAGSGKSTLAVSFLTSGYQYLCDEHPLLCLSSGEVKGLSFVNRIGLPFRSLKYFPELKNKFKPDPSYRKYFLDPVPKFDVAESCNINTVLFPKFVRKGKLRIQKLQPLDFFKKLSKDDYLIIDDRNNLERNLNIFHLDVFKNLVDNSEAYIVEYSASDIRRLPSHIENLLI